MVCPQDHDRFIRAIGRIPLPMTTLVLWTGQGGHGNGSSGTGNSPVAYMIVVFRLMRI